MQVFKVEERLLGKKSISRTQGNSLVAPWRSADHTTTEFIEKFGQARPTACHALARAVAQ